MANFDRAQLVTFKLDARALQGSATATPCGVWPGQSGFQNLASDSGDA